MDKNKLYLIGNLFRWGKTEGKVIVLEALETGGYGYPEFRVYHHLNPLYSVEANNGLYPSKEQWASFYNDKVLK